MRADPKRGLKSLGALAKELGMHRRTLLRRLQAIGKTQRRRVIVRVGRRNYVDVAYLDLLNGRGGKTIDVRLQKLEREVGELREAIEQVVALVGPP